MNEIKDMLVCPRCGTPLKRVINWSTLMFSIRDAGVYKFSCNCMDKSISVTIVSH